MFLQQEAPARLPAPIIGSERLGQRNIRECPNGLCFPKRCFKARTLMVRRCGFQDQPLAIGEHEPGHPMVISVLQHVKVCQPRACVPRDHRPRKVGLLLRQRGEEGHVTTPLRAGKPRKDA